MLNHTHLNPTGWKARTERACAKLEANRSPRTQAIRRVRNATANLEAKQSMAASRWAERHKPVPCPITRTGAMHPHMAALLVTFLSEKGLMGHDPLAPLESGISCEEYVEEACAAARKEIDDANADLVELERREAEFAAIVAAGPEGLTAALAGRAGSPNATDTAPSIEPPVDRTTRLAPVTVLVDESEAIVSEAAPPRRGPGRPRRVDLDDDVLALRD